MTDREKIIDWVARTDRVADEALFYNEINEYEYDIMREESEFNLCKIYAHDEALLEFIRECFSEGVEI